VRLPGSQAASAARNLTAREVVVASNGAYSFAVDLQRLWLDKHRRLDWVKEELEEPARKWSEESVQKQDRSAEDKPPGQQQASRSRRRLILLIGSGILALIVIIGIIAAVMSSSSSSGYPEGDHSFAVASSPTPTLSGRSNSELRQPYVIKQDGVPAATVTITAVRMTTTGADESHTSPQNGYFAIATITIAAMPNFDQSFYIGSGDFHAITNQVHVDEGNGNTWAALANRADELDANLTIGAGQKITKELLFDVPSKHGTILYAPAYGSVIAQWNY
jgi:hypothetical protein